MADQLNANKVKFAESKDMLLAVTQLQEMYKAGHFGANALADTYADTQKAMASGKYAMTVVPMGMPTDIEKSYPDVKADTFGFFTMPLVDNTLAPAHPAGPAKFIYSARSMLLRRSSISISCEDGEPAVSARQHGAVPLAQLHRSEEQVDTGAGRVSQELSGQDHRVSGSVNYLNPQWMDIGKDLTAMFTGALTPEEVLKNIDQRRADMAMAAKDAACPSSRQPL